MAKPLVIIPLLILCVSAASGQEAPPIPIQSKDSNIILTCRPQKPLSHTWICVDQNGKEIRNLLIKDREAK
jgi:hypothetical protein